MKACEFCAEMVAEDAERCRYCGERSSKLPNALLPKNSFELDGWALAIMLVAITALAVMLAMGVASAW